MRLLFKIVALFAGCALSLSRPGLAQDEQIGLRLGVSPPTSIKVETLDGQTVDLASYLGKKPVLIEFWATWCPVCQALLPKIEAAHQKYGDQVDFVVVAVGVNETPRSIKRHMDQHPMPFEPLWDGKGVAVRAFEAPSTSYIVGLNAKGKVAYTGLGDRQDIEAAVAKILDGKGR
ncbi:MAG: redoxin domain-containing protein [Gemmatimonadetes bacterium]|nr:redoxin domain-containing protein [Gemmatimonadota bacterium]